MRPLILLAFVLALAGCATWQAPGEVSDSGLRGRAISDTSQGVRVSAAVLSADDTRRMFGTDLAGAQIQPVWVEIQNTTAQPKWLLRTGTDPDYFSPLEVAWSAHTTLGGSVNAAIDEHFDKLGFKNPIAPGTTRAGIIFTNPEQGIKLLNVDVLGPQALVPFTLFLPVPQDTAVAGATAPQGLFRYPASEITDYRELAELRAALERLARRGDAGRAAERGAGGRARGHRGGDGAPQLPPRCTRGRHGSPGLRPRPGRGAAQAGAAHAPRRPGSARGARRSPSRAARSSSARSGGRSAGASRLPTRPTAARTRTSTRRETS